MMLVHRVQAAPFLFIDFLSHSAYGEEGTPGRSVPAWTLLGRTRDERAMMHLELKRLWRQGEVAGAHSGAGTGGPVSLVQEAGNGNEFRGNSQ